MRKGKQPLEPVSNGIGYRVITNGMAAGRFAAAAKGNVREISRTGQDTAAWRGGNDDAFPSMDMCLPERGAPVRKTGT